MRRRPAGGPPSRARRLAGGGLVVVGLLMVSFATTRYADGAVRAERAREQWELDRARAAVRAIRAGAFTTVAGYGFERGAPLARLRIPALGLDEIVVEGVGDTELNVGPGHVPGTAVPGEPGNAVISAHRDRHFLPLERLEVGDSIVTDVGAASTTWIVTGRRVVQAGEPALFQTATPTLTLTTCWPIRFFGPAPERLLITAEPVPGPREPRT